jgi:HSP20 family protein
MEKGFDVARTPRGNFNAKNSNRGDITMSQIVTKGTDGNVAVAERTRNDVTYTPRFDIVETPDELLLFGDMPGVAPGTLDVKFENEHLIVHGKVDCKCGERELIYDEYGIGDFYREFRINETVDAGKISAEMKNGVLTVHLPKAEAVKPKRIEVKVG